MPLLRHKLVLLLICAVGAVLLSAPLALPVAAHPGGLNGEGCHAGSQPYHCHKKKAKLKQATEKKVEKNKDRIEDLKQKRQDAVESGDPKKAKRTRDRVQKSRERLKNTRETAQEKRKTLILKNKAKNNPK